MGCRFQWSNSPQSFTITPKLDALAHLYPGVAGSAVGNQARYNALYALDPDVLVRHLSAFERGDICGLERVLDEFELREDKMKIGAFKMAAAVSSKPWEVRIRKGEEENPRAKVHQKALTRFWNRVEATPSAATARAASVCSSSR